MSNGEERRRAREEAVEAAYHSLSVHHVDSRRIVFINDGRKFAGGYGVVRRAEFHHSPYLPAWLASRQYGPPQLVAVKQMRMSAADNSLSLKAAFTKELLVWSSLEGHPGIAKFLGFHADFERSEAWLISPWEPHGSVSEFIHQHELEVPEKLSLVYDTIDALVFLHQLNPPICHGDIKSANVLVNAECRAVLCDFGLARLYEDSGFGRMETSTGFKGSIRWCSPELLDGQPRTSSSDIYAWAWLVWEIMTGQLPYGEGTANYVIIRKIFESSGPQVDGESRLSDCLQVWELMKRCWASDPSRRPTSGMCRTTITFLPRCPPTHRDGQHQARSPALLENVGDLESWKGNYEDGLAYLEQALQLYEQEGNDRGIASVLRKQASISYRHSYHVQAFDAASASLQNFQSLGDALGIAEALYLMGSALTVQSDHNRASLLLKDSLKIFWEYGIDVGVIQCLERLGEVQRREEKWDQALATLGEAVDLASRCGDRLGEAKCLIILGVTQWDRGDLTQAASTISVACEMARSIGWEHGVCTTLWDLGRLRRDQESPEEAIDLLQESIAVARRSRFPWRMAQALQELGGCLQDQGRLDGAANAFKEAFSVYQGISLADEAGYIALVLGDLKKQQGSLRSSLFWYDAAVAEKRKHGSKPSIVSCLIWTATALELAGEYDVAALHFEASLVLRQEIGGSAGIGWYRQKISRIPMTTMKWESRRHSRLRFGESHQASHLLCDVNRLQRRIPLLLTPGLKLEVRLSREGITN